MSLYELIIIGNPTDEQRKTLVASVQEAVSDFGFSIGAEVAVRDSSTVGLRDPKASSAVVFFLGDALQDIALASHLLARRIALIPVVNEAGTFEVLPDDLKVPNGLRLSSADPNMEGLTAALLETLGLLRQQRRTFISYRRTEARPAALQLHDLLASRGFDVFLDTHEIRPGEPFQEVLWHRMTDSDVMVVLDTATYFERRWTREEFGKAMAKEIHILRLVWPGHTPTEHLSTGEMVRLAESDLTKRKTLKMNVAKQIAVSVERIRSRSIAARFRSLTGKLASEATRIGAKIEGIGGRHAVAIRLSRGKRIWAFPAVGVPTASTLNEAYTHSSGLDIGAAVVVYDHAGVREDWIKHLDWLDENIGVVDAIKVFDAGSRLVELDTTP